MRVLLHIGPHKTGTTSIQAYLLERFGSGRPRPPIWYPAPASRGPGHAHLAALMNHGTLDSASNPLRRLVEETAEAGVETLVLSSEDFIGGHRRKRLDRYAEALSGHEVVLISTQSPVARRIVSVWEEMVKHGHTAAMATSAQTILKESRLRPHLLSAFAHAIRPSAIVVVFSDRGDPPHLLIDRFLSASGLPADDGNRQDASLQRNVSLGFVEAEVLRRLNQLLESHAPDITPDGYRALRDALLGAFEAEAWRTHCPRRRVEPPEQVREAALVRAHELAAEIEALGREWPVTIVGDPGTLARVGVPSDAESIGPPEGTGPKKTPPGSLRLRLHTPQMQQGGSEQHLKGAEERAEEAEDRYERLRNHRAVRVSLRVADLVRPLRKVLPGARRRGP